MIDGASTDGSRELLTGYTAPEMVSVSEPDKGIYDAMNKGVGLSSGEWVIFMNAGDTFASGDVLELAAKVLGALPKNIDVAYGDVLKDGVIKRAEPPHNSHRMFFCHQSAFNRRDTLVEYPFDIRHKLSADFKFYKTLISKRRGFRQLDFAVANFDTSGISNSRRSTGLADNMRVIAEVDGVVKGLPFILHLIPTYLLSRLRGK